MTILNKVENLGFAIVPNILDVATTKFIAEKVDALESGKETKQRGEAAFGIRNLINLMPEIRSLAESCEVRNLVESFLGKNVIVVRSIFFDKTPGANWKVPFHQDLTIAVRAKIETAHFVNWTIKAGIHHVQPPVEILEKMLTLRIHLDNANENNGALRVVPGSHRNGRLSGEQTQNLKNKSGIVMCEINAGSAMLMKPLLLHASSVSAEPKRRRVIHLEFSAGKLPNGLEWFGS